MRRPRNGSGAIYGQSVSIRIRSSGMALATSTAGSDLAVRLRSALTGMAGDADGRAVLGMLRLDGFRHGDLALYEPIAAKVAALRGMPG